MSTEEQAAARITPPGFARPQTRWATRWVLPVVIVSALYFGLIIYPPLRIIGLLLPDWQPGTPMLMTLLVGPLALRVAAELLSRRTQRPAVAAAGRACAALVMTGFGIGFMTFPMVITWELLNLVHPLPAQTSGLALAGLASLLGIYAFVNAQRLTVRAHTLRVPASAPRQAAGIRLVQISDVHVGSRTPAFLARVVRRVNQLDADVVLITGDLIDFAGIGEAALASLGTLRAPVFFAIGNHERYVDLEAICARLTRVGVRVLRNEAMVAGHLQLIGIDDAEPKTQVGRVLPYLEPAPDRYRILLYHRPDGATDAAAWGVHLMLCGHTHNGQIVPFNFLVKRVFPHICGLYDVDPQRVTRTGITAVGEQVETTLHVSPGTGTWGPILRLGSRAEITHITLA
ncbi:MAG: metallophosphoesterase [Gammaproteobacteria bacterium]